jgi:hypothetical protein
MTMNITRSPFFQKTILLTLTIGAAHSVHAGFQFNPRNVVLGLRQSGGGSELTVNAGSISNLLALTTGQSVIITNLTSVQVVAAFPDLNNLSWSVSADVRDGGDATYPQGTLWVTRPRTVFNAQTTPWNRQSQFSQGGTASKIDGIGNNAAAYGNVQPTGPNNTSSGILIPAGSQYAYSTFMGGGNFAGAFQGNVEVTTDPDFDTAGQSVRADFYELKPGTGAGTYLGFFELDTNGVLTYKAGPSAAVIPQPSIVSIVRAGNLNTVTFTTVGGASYDLLASTNLLLPLASWTTVGSPMAGDGSNKALSDTTTEAQKFYLIQAHP